MSRKALFKFVFFPVVFRPARALSYRTVALKDLLAPAVYINVVFPLALPDFPLGLGTRENPVRLVLGV